MPGPFARTAAALAGTPFAQIRWCAQTASTNEDASALLGTPGSGGVTIVADHQTAGAGRKGRSWLARPAAGLLFTTILPEPVPAADIWAVPFWTALAVRAGLAACGVATDLHWPNDLLVGPRKIAGILCASRVTGPLADVACGIGINVTRAPGDDGAIEPPPAFCDDVRAVERDDLLTAVLTQFAASVELLRAPQRVARRWEEEAGLPGRPYRLLVDGEGAPFDARAIALATGGALVVERDGRRETIALADARALREAP